MADEPAPAGPNPAGDIRISSDPADLDIDWIHGVLSTRAYWALGRSRERVESSLRHSIVFGAFAGRRQLGVARVITDEATFAWICDVFVEEPERGRGIGSALMAAVVADPRLQGLRRMVLSTRDADALYARFGFTPLAHPDRWMERRPDRPAGATGD